MENKGERGVGKGIAGLKQQLKGGTEVGNEDDHHSDTIGGVYKGE